MTSPLLGASAPARPDPPLLLVGTDFRCSPIELRERVALGKEEAEKTLVHLLARSEIAEAFLLSTCNRTELYLQPRDEDLAYQAALEMVFLAREPELERPGRLYVKRNGEAARHLLAVAGGLESMVLGEPEILGQVKAAAALAEAIGAEGPVLKRLLRSAITAGKRTRQETAIAAGAVSIGYAIVELARQIFSGLDDCRVLLIGAGEIARSVARPLIERGARELRVANRGGERARQFQEEFAERRADRLRGPPGGGAHGRPGDRLDGRRGAGAHPPPARPRRCAPAPRGRCWWSTSGCRATSSRPPAAPRTSSSTPSTRSTT